MPPTAPTAPAAPTAPTAPATPSAPASPPVAAKPAQAAPAESSQPAPPLNDAFSEIDKIISESQLKTPERPTAKAPVKPAEKPTDKPADKVTTPDTDDEVKGFNAPQLKSAYQQRKRELHEAKEKLANYEAKIKEMESKAVDPTRLTELQQKIEAAEKRAAELDTELRFSNYERSEEYKQKYHEPFLQSYQAGRNKIATLKIVERKNPETEEVIQPSRRATAEDFDAIMRIADDSEAAEMADRMFGPLANLVIYHREKVADLNGARVKAIEDYRAKGSEREQQTKAQAQAKQEQLKGTFKKSVEDGMAKYPQWFKAPDDDAQGKKVLEQGLLNADMVFSNTGKSPEELVQLHAAVRNMAGAFPYVALKLHRAEARMKELEAELEQYKKSEPTEETHPRGEKGGFVSADEEFDNIVAASR